MSRAVTDFVVQGWCPGALRPMMSGDGLVVRVRPNAGQLTAAQAAGIARAARVHGNGLIDLSARANVQLRGVSMETHAALIDDLRALQLIDADISAEARRNLLVTPFADAMIDSLAAKMAQEMAQGPDLPGKFGFAVDCGPRPVLCDTPADIRLERDAEGGLLLRCDGAPLGASVTAETASKSAVALARWFVDAGGVTDGRGRMAGLLARGVVPDGVLAGRIAPAAPVAVPGPGLTVHGALVGFEFGQMTADTLAALAGLGRLRVTPWRMLLIEGLTTMPDLPGLIVRPDDALRRVHACTGAPGCVQGLRAVRPLARRLAADVPPGAILHVSGCAKGCAHPGRAALTLIASQTGFDLVRNGTAQDTPDLSDLPEAELNLKDHL